MFRPFLKRLLARTGRALTQPLIDEMRAERKALFARMSKFEDRIVKKVNHASERREKDAVRQQKLLEALASDLDRQRAEVRLALARQRAPAGRAEGGPRITLTADELPELEEQSSQAMEVPKDSILSLSACPVCEGAGFTPVCEYNKLLLLESGVDAEARVYDYALCHDCGVVYARQRPAGRRYAHLLDRFEVTLGRAQDGVPRSGNIVLSSGALSDTDRNGLRERLAKGVFVSEHSGLSRREYLPALQQDRLAMSVHVELLGSLLRLKAPRVLELRPRLGSIGAALRRLYGAEVFGMPLFDGQQFLIRETYGIPTDHKVDYDHFSIPYEGQFDLIVANHMFTHVVRPREFFLEVRRRLKPGGHIYLYNEPDERDFLHDGKSMINTLNAFHLQTFDNASLVRALGACGFEPVFVTHQNDSLIALARAGDLRDDWPHMDTGERERRVAAYHRARDAAILRLPDRLRPHFAGEWDAIVERSFAAGLVDFDEEGRLRMVKHDRPEA